MRALIDRLGRRLGLGVSPARDMLTVPADWHARPNIPLVTWTENPVFAAASKLPDGTPCSDELRAALDREIHARRARADALAGPPPPTMTGLRIRREGLPDWWERGGNLMLVGDDTGPIEISLGLPPREPRGAVVLLGARVKLMRIQCTGDGALTALGDDVVLNVSTVALSRGGMVLVGERTTATWLAGVTAHADGVVVAGADGMWAAGVNMMTDDSHAIRDLKTDVRLNRLGGRIVIEQHVWIGQHAQLTGDCWIGRDGVIGQGALVRNVVLPPNTVSVGRPARPGRRGITWSRHDLP